MSTKFFVLLNNHQKKSYGFTLIELIVVTAIFAVIALVIVQVFFVTTRSNTKTELMRDVKQNGDQALDTMVRLLQNATTVSVSSCPDSSENPISVSSLTLVGLDGGETTLFCQQESEYARIASSSAGRTIFLTNENVSLWEKTRSKRTCTPLFQCTSIGGEPSRIRIHYTLVQKEAHVSSALYMSAQASFETSVTLRNK